MIAKIVICLVYQRERYVEVISTKDRRIYNI